MKKKKEIGDESKVVRGKGVSALLQQSDNPEREKMMALACKQGGMEVFVGDDFRANADSPRSVWPQLRKDYLEVHAAVDMAFYLSFVEKGLAMILTAETVRTSRLVDIHLNLAGFATQYGKPQGRPLTDGTTGWRPKKPRYNESNSEPEQRTKLSVLNSESAKAQSVERYEVIQHPTIIELVHMILRMQEQPRHRFGEKLILWSADVDGAYTRLWFRSEDVKWMAAELVGGLIILFLCGVFGWTGTHTSCIPCGYTSAGV